MDLALEALGAQHRGKLGPQELESDPAVVFQVLGEVDRGHAAVPQLAVNYVSVAESVPELDGDVGHGGGTEVEALGICTDRLGLASMMATLASASRALPIAAKVV